MNLTEKKMILSVCHFRVGMMSMPLNITLGDVVSLLVPSRLMSVIRLIEAQASSHIYCLLKGSRRFIHFDNRAKKDVTLFSY